LLAHHIFKQKPAVSIIPYLGLILRDGAFGGFGVCSLRPKDEVEVSPEGQWDGFDAAGAENLELSLVARAYADVVYVGVCAAVLDDQVGLALNFHRPNLQEIGSILEIAWRYDFSKG
jgi:hypothetical protein